MWQPISAEEKLAVTLQFLATGESYQSLIYRYRIHQSANAQFIIPVCHTIYKVLSPEYMKVPSTKDEWMKIINKTYEKWNFPNAYAAADGNHILIIRQNNVSSEFYNCKGFHSIVLLEFVDHYYRYLVAEVGCQGRISDGGVYKNSAFHSSLKKRAQPSRSDEFTKKP